MCGPKHPTHFKAQKNTSNILLHYRTHHPEFANAMQHAGEKGEAAEKTLKTLLEGHSMKKESQQTLYNFWKQSSVCDGM